MEYEEVEREELLFKKGSEGLNLIMRTTARFGITGAYFDYGRMV